MSKKNDALIRLKKINNQIRKIKALEVIIRMTNKQLIENYDRAYLFLISAGGGEKVALSDFFMNHHRFINEYGNHQTKKAAFVILRN